MHSKVTLVKVDPTNIIMSAKTVETGGARWRWRAVVTWSSVQCPVSSVQDVWLNDSIKGWSPACCTGGEVLVVCLLITFLCSVPRPVITMIKCR